MTPEPVSLLPQTFGEGPCAPEDQGKLCEVAWEQSLSGCYHGFLGVWCCDGEWQSESPCQGSGGGGGMGGESSGGEGGVAAGAPNGGAP